MFFVALNSIVEEYHYDPFGLNLTGIEKQGQPDDLFQFSSKEKQEEFGLNWNDHSWRYYDPQLGRFHVIDPSAESYDAWTPYNYVGDNPMLMTDPDGMDWYKDQDGKEIQIWGASGDIDGYTWSKADNTTYGLAEVTVTASRDTEATEGETLTSEEDVKTFFKEFEVNVNFEGPRDNQQINNEIKHFTLEVV